MWMSNQRGCGFLCQQPSDAGNEPDYVLLLCRLGGAKLHTQ